MDEHNAHFKPDRSENSFTQGTRDSTQIHCQLCAKISRSIQKFIDGKFGEEQIGLFADCVNNRECTNCQQIVSYFTQYPLTETNSKNAYLIMSFHEGSKYFFFGVGKGILVLRYANVHSCGSTSIVSGEHCYHAELDDQWIDIRQVSEWLKGCNMDHSGTCHSVLDPWKRIDIAQDIILMDVERQCLVRRSSSCKYLALSYVWGNAQNMVPFQTTQKEFPSLCQDGAFTSSHGYNRLPRTIRDSMVLCKKMGLRYLWVDRFCIVQDDADNKSEQLKAMASIYANAYFTIAACEGTNDGFGLPGIGEDRPRSRPFWVFNFGSTFRMISMDPTRSFGWDKSHQAPYHSRGWTFQEWELSPRILAFHHNTVSWLCHMTEEQENGCPSSHKSLPGSTGLRLLSSGLDLPSYTPVVETYSHRELTYQDDILKAFSAVIAVMGRSMSGGIFFGLPEISFDSALLWKPRKKYAGKTSSTGRRIGFPSWSWAGWNGGIDTSIWSKSTYETPKDETVTHYVTSNYIIHPINTWYKISKTGEKAKIPNVLHDNPKIEQLLLPDVPKPQLPSESEWSHVIHFRSHQLYLRIEIDATSAKRQSTNESVLVNSTGSCVGILEHEAQISLGNGQIVELVSISRMEAGKVALFYLPESRYFHQNCPPNCLDNISTCKHGLDWRYKWYNVLWIEWKDGIAYRRALGRVFQDYWDNAEKEEIDVRLG